MQSSRTRLVIQALVACSGVAGLTWELLWQHHAALAIGVSARGTAITLSCVMAGLAAGSLGMGALLRRRGAAGARIRRNPLHAYALMEVIIGASGALLGTGFALLSDIDTLVYRSAPSLTAAAQGMGIALLLALPSLAMGATIPLFRLLAERYDTQVGWLYGLNTAGAAVGVVLASFLLLPAVGVELTGSLASALNLAVALLAVLPRWPRGRESAAEPGASRPGAVAAVPVRVARTIALVTGLVTFMLEVSWFRSLRAAFQATSESFALILVAVLIPLAAGARLGTHRRFRRELLPVALMVAGGLALALTPLVERMDLLNTLSTGFWTTVAGRLGLSLLLLGAPMLALGTALPWLMEQQPDSTEVGRLYAANTAGAVVGSLGTAWLLLPVVGASAAAWIAGGILVLLAAALATAGPRRWILCAGVVATVVAVAAGSGAGRTRVQAVHLEPGHRVLATTEGPDATVSVVENPDGVRELVIDGFQTSGEARTGHYMAWMGRLPMIAHAAPARALVICFGSGQTANALRREGAAGVDVVELSPAVISMAPLFGSNEGVLEDPRVRTIIMDGRAWLRRTTDRYDVVTLEPMAPNFAGTNSLYSLEFYRLVADRLVPGGVVAQWLPLHLVSPRDAMSIARTFTTVFPDALLWIDPVDRTGILLGRAEGAGAPGPAGLSGPASSAANGWGWPGLAREAGDRGLSDAAIRGGALLFGESLHRYMAAGIVIDDDNQLLSYGGGRLEVFRYGADLHDFNLKLVANSLTGEPF